MNLSNLMPIAFAYLSFVGVVTTPIVCKGLAAIWREPRPCPANSGYRRHTAAYLRTTQHIHESLRRIPDGN